MRTSALPHALVISLLLCGSVLAAGPQQEATALAPNPPEECPYPQWWKLSPDALKSTLEKHREWLERHGNLDPAIPGRANLCNANLRGAILRGAVLRGAVLYEAKLSGADLSGADLTDASLHRSKVTNAQLAGAILTGALYAPESPPPAPYLVGVEGLETVAFFESWQLTLFYLWPIARSRSAPNPRGAIYRIWPKERIIEHEGQAKEAGEDTVERLHARWLAALGYATYFSLMSAFNIGFREFNVGTWIARVQAHKYSLEPTGWVRVVSGLQSLLSVYLLAIWALTYFGRPFE